MRAAAGGIAAIKPGPPQANARYSPLAFRVLTLPTDRRGMAAVVVTDEPHCHSFGPATR